MDKRYYRLRDLIASENRFLCGVELVTTRGTLSTAMAQRTRSFSSELLSYPHVDWVSITDNAGGNPMLSPMALGKPLLYGGKEVVIHLSCKDMNRNALESEAWQLASEGFHNILSLSGDYPVTGYHGPGKPVFDIDSVALLTLLQEMNDGLGVPPAPKTNGEAVHLEQTDFFSGAVTSNFKQHENEVVPQYLKLEKKVACGAKFIIAQIGFDARKSSEMRVYMDQNGMRDTPLIGNVYLLSAPVARFFHTGHIPGVVVTERLRDLCVRQARSPDHGKTFFLEFAAKQTAITRGLGYRGVYFGGAGSLDDIDKILEIERSFGPDDWKTLAREINFSPAGTFHYYAEDPSTGLADGSRLEPVYAASLEKREKTANVTLGYRMNRVVHELAFSPGKGMHGALKRLYTGNKSSQGPALLQNVERVGKALLFQCKDCGDCSLPDIAYLCPESQCAKNARNGPCGGTRNGLCEVNNRECIWARAYDRLKWEGRERDLLGHAPVLQDQGLRGTSSWRNTFLGKDHHKLPDIKKKPGEAKENKRAIRPRETMENSK
ncbi:MAG: methylenetetrahydrofolate reductase C-terminal domain-containing protein [Candidatus Hydrogenedentes bacterium]|nr:methylenetetrahydrofolate reductase C-terminal domain-containing protein [Candidatus Hydrogenedentota bacterium]